MPLLSLIAAENQSQSLESLLRDPLKKKSDSSEALFESSQSQKILGKMKNFAEVIKLINSEPSVLPTSKTFLNNDIPVIEVNVRVGENIADALKEKLVGDKRLNINFQPRNISSKLQKYNFDIPPLEKSSEPTATQPLLADAPTISNRELQLVAETTEATNNILDATINRMLTELGSTSIDTDTTQLISAANNPEQPDPETSVTREEEVFGNALLSTEKLQQVEDIRAIFEILGIGS